MTHRRIVQQRRQDIVDAWTRGETIAGIARATGVSRGAVLGLIEAEGLRDARTDAKAAARAHRRELVVEHLRRHPGASVEEAAAAAGIRPRTAVGYLKGTPEETLVVGTRPGRVAFERDEMLRALRIAWANVPAQERKHGLSTTLYEKHAPSPSPSPSLYDKRFGSWRAACAAADVPLELHRRRSYTRTFDTQDIVDAVGRYIDETGSTTFSGYCAWARDRLGEVPSGALVVSRMGRWSEARTAVIAAGGRQSVA